MGERVFEARRIPRAQEREIPLGHLRARQVPIAPYAENALLHHAQRTLPKAPPPEPARGVEQVELGADRGTSPVEQETGTEHVGVESLAVVGDREIVLPDACCYTPQKLRLGGIVRHEELLGGDSLRPDPGEAHEKDARAGPG